MRSLANKQCFSDPQLTWRLKANADILSPFLCQLRQQLPRARQCAVQLQIGLRYATAEADLDTADVKSYRPIAMQPVRRL